MKLLQIVANDLAQRSHAHSDLIFAVHRHRQAQAGCGGRVLPHAGAACPGGEVDLSLAALVVDDVGLADLGVRGALPLERGRSTGHSQPDEIASSRFEHGHTGREFVLELGKHDLHSRAQSSLEAVKVMIQRAVIKQLVNHGRHQRVEAACAQDAAMVSEARHQSGRAVCPTQPQAGSQDL